MPLLEATNLNLFLRTDRGSVQALRNITFKLERGSALGLIGESGCGKSLTAMALMGLLPANAQATGSLRLDGQELLGHTPQQWQQLRGRRMAMVFQEPMTALNPVHTVGQQVAEPLVLHRGLSRPHALQAAVALLDRVGIANAAQRVHDHPHQFSGGQRQRITIAMALAAEPDILIADEPTTALDVTVQQQILDLIQDLVAERHMALILISHDLGVISQNVDDMLVMYGGQIVESGPTAAIFRHMGHPYTRGLLAARPRLDAVRQPSGKPKPLFTIAGSVPTLADVPRGCPFAGRCSYTQPQCHDDAPPRVGMPSFQPHEAPHSSLGVHLVRCLRPEAMRPGNTEAWT